VRTYLLDVPMLIFLLVCVPIAYWVAADTERWLRAAGRSQSAVPRRSQILALRIPALFVAIAGTVWILLTLVCRLAR
jgi:hypothetical protein